VFDISGLMRRVRRLLKTVLVLSTLGIVYNEFLIYYLVLWQCNYPLQSATTSTRATVTAMVLADTHLLGPRNGHWFDKLRREWQMHRAFQTSMTYFQPETVFFLGDLFDEGQWSSEAEFNVYLHRFRSLFHVDSRVTQVFVMAGNHDIGFHYVASSYPHLDLRFKTALKTKTVQKVVVKNVTFVTINSMAFEGDGCSMCQRAAKAVRKLGTSLREQSDGNNQVVKPILMSHFPLYRVSDSHCDEVDEAPEEEKEVEFREKWDCISKESSEFLLEELQPRLVLSGHTHNGCKTNHGNVTEWTLTSFSWRNKKNPSFLLGKFSNDSVHLEKCQMPDENTVFNVYIILAFLSIISVLKP